jgi:hypothetical protein
MYFVSTCMSQISKDNQFLISICVIVFISIIHYINYSSLDSKMTRVKKFRHIEDFFFLKTCDL